MAQGYNLTVQLNLQGPKNLNNIVNNINQKLNNIQATVNVKTSPQTAQILNNIANASKGVQQGADQAASAMENFGKSAGLAIKRFGAFTAATAGFYAIARATSQSLAQFIEYDKQITRIAQVTGTTKDAVSDLSNEITRLSTSLGVSSSSLAQVAVTLSQAGLSANQTKQALESLALTTLGASFDDINNTVEGSIALMKQFNISTSQLESALGSINSVAAAFAVEAGDIITAIQRTGGVFAAASNGVSQGTDALNEFIAVFTSVRATTRESAETIATGLRTIFTRIQREDTLAALKEFGITLTDLEGKFVGPYRAIELLSQGLKTLDPRSISFSSLVEELGGFRQVGKVIPLIQQFSTAQQALNVAQQGSGSLAKDAALGQEALAVQIAKVQEEFNALIRSIGETAEFKQFIRLSLDLASALIQVGDAIKPVLPAVSALGAIGIAKGIAPLARGFRGAIGFNSGGLVPGSGSTDTVPAMLTPGEFVIRKKAVKSLGVSRLSNMNKYAVGGEVDKDHFTHLDQGPLVYKNKELYGKGLSGIGLMLPGSWNTAFMRGDAQITGKQLFDEINKRDIDTLFSRLLGGSRETSGKAGSLIGGQKNPLYSQLIDPNKKILEQMKQAILSSIDTSEGKIYSQDADLYPIGKAMYESAPKGLRGALTKIRKVQGISGGLLSTGSYGTLNVTGPKTPGAYSFQQTPSIFKSLLKYRRANRGGPIHLASGGSTDDTIPAMLTPGEFVINSKAARKIGKNTLNRLNHADKRNRVQGFNKGGWVGLNNGGSPPPVGRLESASSGLQAILLLQVAASGFASAVESSGDKFSAQMSQATQGLVTGLTAGIVAFQAAATLKGASGGIGGIGNAVGFIGKLAGPIGLLTGVVTGAVGAMNGFINASKDFEKNLRSEQITSSLSMVGSAFDRLEKNMSDAGALRDVSNYISTATKNIGKNTEVEYKAFFGNALETVSGLFTDQSPEEQRVAAQRSLILERRGFSAYRESFDDRTREKQIREINKTRGAENAAAFSSVAEQSIKLFENRINAGQSVDQVRGLPEFDQLAESIARANPEIEQQILNLQSSGKAEDLLQAKKIVTEEAIRKLREMYAIRQNQIALQASQNVALQTERSLNRIFTTIEDSFGAVADSVQRKFDSIDVSLQGLSGSFKPGLTKPQNLTALENPTAFSKQAVTDAIQAIKPLFGTQQTLISGLAQGGFSLEADLATSLGNVLSKSTVGTQPEALRSSLQVAAQELIKGYGLAGTDVEKVVTDQLGSAIDSLLKDGKDLKSPEAIQQLIDGISASVPGFKASLELAIKATSQFASAQQSYVDKINQIAEVRIQQEQYLIQANSILRNSVLDLNKALGQDIGIQDISKNFFANISELTGGATRPQDIYNNLQRLSQTQESLIERRDALAGKPDERSVREFQALSQELLNTTVAISQNRSALEQLANSSVVASAALGKIQEVQQQRQQQVQFLEKLVSSGPEESERFKQTFDALNAVAAGQTLTLNNSTVAQEAYIDALRQGRNVFEAQIAARGALAQQRGDVLGLAKELAPFMKDTQAGRDLQASLLESFLRDTGNLSPQFKEIVDSIRQPQEDPKIKPLIDIYNRASTLQANANVALGSLVDIDKSLINTNNVLIGAINDLRQAITQASARDIVGGVQPAGRPQDPVPVQIRPDPVPRPRNRVPPWMEDPITRSNGGVVYASQGQYIGAKPKGTDTVPAMLTRGEFVVNKDATKKNLSLLEAINGNKTAYASKGGMIYAQEGGQVPWFMGINPEEWFNQQVAMLQQQAGMGVQRVVPLQAINRLRGQAAFIQMQQQAYEYQETLRAAQKEMQLEMFAQLKEQGRISGPLARNRGNLLKPISGMDDAALQDFIRNNPAQAQKLLSRLQNVSALERKQKQYQAKQQEQQEQQGASRFRPLKGNFATVPSSERAKAKQQSREKQLLADYQKAKAADPALRARDYAYDERLTQDEEDFLLKATSGIGLTGQDTVASRAYTEQKEKERKARLDAKAEELAKRLREDMAKPEAKPTSTKPDLPLPPQPEKPRESVAEIRERVKGQREDQERKNRAEKYGLPPNTSAEEVDQARKAERAAFRQKQAWVAEWRSIVAKRKSSQTVYWSQTSFTNPEAVGYIRSLGFQFADELDEYLPATNVTGDVGGRIPSTQDLSAMTEMANRTGNSIGTQAIPTANMAYPGLDEQQLGRFLSGVRTARNRPRSSLPTSAVTSNYGDGYSITSYPDGTVKVNVPSATEVADKTRGVWFDTNGNRVDPGETQITGMGGRVDPSRGTVVDKPIYERSMLAADLASTFGGVAGVSPAGRTRYQPNMPTKPTLPPGTRLVRNTVVPGTNVTTPTIEVGANYTPGSISTSVIGIRGKPADKGSYQRDTTQIRRAQLKVTPRTNTVNTAIGEALSGNLNLPNANVRPNVAPAPRPRTTPPARASASSGEEGLSQLAQRAGLSPSQRRAIGDKTAPKILPSDIDINKLSEKARQSLRDQGFEVPRIQTQTEKDLTRAQLERAQATNPATLQVLPNETPQQAAKRVAEIKALKPGNTTDPAWKRRGFRIAQPTQQTTPDLPSPNPLTTRPTTVATTRPVVQTQQPTVNKPTPQPVTKPVVKAPAENKPFTAQEAASSVQQPSLQEMLSGGQGVEKFDAAKANQDYVSSFYRNVYKNLFGGRRSNQSTKTAPQPTKPQVDPQEVNEVVFLGGAKFPQITGSSVPRASARSDKDAALQAKFFAEWQSMPRELDKFRTYIGPGYNEQGLPERGSQTYVAPTRYATSDTNMRTLDISTPATVIEKMRAQNKERGFNVDKRFTIVDNPRISQSQKELGQSIQIYGDDPGGRKNSVLYNIDTRFISDLEAFKKDIISRGYEYFNKGGIVSPKYLSTGGQLVNYEPRGTDTIPAMLSKGEFVVNREATKKNLGLLRAINRSRGGKVKNGVLYAEAGTNNPIGNINSSFSSSGDMNVSGRIQVDIPTPTMPQIGTADPTMTNSLQTFSVSLQNFVSQGINPFITASSNFATKIQSQISSNIPGTQPFVSANPSNTPTTATTLIQAPQIDFTQFTTGIQSFGAFAQPLTQALQTLSTVNFGVINDGATTLNTSATTLGQALGRLNASINGFSEKTNEFINKMGSLKLDGTITVGGTIAMEPLQVNIGGLDAIEARIQGFAPLIIGNIALALEQDNPGINTTSLKASTTLFNR